MKVNQPLYLSLYEKLKIKLSKVNDRFPSKRQLSNYLSVSHTTIEHAYQLLVDEGFIYSKPRSGYFVSDIESLPVIHRQTNQLNTDNLEKKQRQYKYAFNLAEIDSESFMHF